MSISAIGALAIAGVTVAVWLSLGEASARPSTLDIAFEPDIENGRYLATIGNCQTCHTTAGGEPFAGGVAFETQYGVIHSTNITMDRETGIGAWSLDDFRNAMLAGVRPDGAHLYPAFPYTSFAKLTDDDIASLFAFLQTVDAVNAPAEPNELGFPWNQRPLLRIWKTLFHDHAIYAPKEDESPEWNRGAYLVEGLAHCGACHTPRNALGAERADQPLAGGVYLDEVTTGAVRPWAAPNLTPASTGLAAWSHEDIVGYLTTGESDRAVVHGPMNKVVLNSTQHLSDSDASAVATYLKSIPPIENAPATEPDEATMRAGVTLYSVHCGTCHLPTGLGDQDLGVPLAANALVQASDPSSLINVILYGPELAPPPFASDRKPMESFGKKLSDEQISHIASYIRASWGNTASPVTPAQVAAQR